MPFHLIKCTSGFSSVQEENHGLLTENCIEWHTGSLSTSLLWLQTSHRLTHCAASIALLTPWSMKPCLSTVWSVGLQALSAMVASLLRSLGRCSGCRISSCFNTCSQSPNTHHWIIWNHFVFTSFSSALLVSVNEVTSPWDEKTGPIYTCYLINLIDMSPHQAWIGERGRQQWWEF